MAVALILAAFLMTTGCYTNVHQVGLGAQTGVKIEKKQWFALWGLIALNEVDSQQLTAGAANYTLRTESTPTDVIIGVILGAGLITPRTVTVTQ
ncbi:MAG: hypothetical protein PHI18_10210 [bacterium]|nr:hypothetical protein [bacterium]